jgi:hypothetical protein
MSSPWGPALDAELAYRHQQARNDFRGWTWRRKQAPHASAQHVAAEAATHHRPAQQFPAQRVPALRVPAPLMPVDGGRVIAAVGGG